MTLTLHTPEGILTLILAPHVVPTPQNLARELRLEGLPPEKCGALGRLLAAAAEVEGVRVEVETRA